MARDQWSIQCLTADQRSRFDAATDTRTAVRIVSDALQFKSIYEKNSDKCNPFLVHMMNRYKTNKDNVMKRVTSLNERSASSEVASVIRKVTLLIANQSAAPEASESELALLYRTRCHLFLLKHEHQIRKLKDHGTQSYMAALMDLETAIHCDSGNQPDSAELRVPGVKQLRRRIATAKNSCLQKECAKCSNLPSDLKRSCNSYSPDEGYRSLSPQSLSSREIRVCNSVTKGRFLRTCRNLKSGEEIWSESAFVSSLVPDLHASRCFHCYGRISDSFTKCDRNCPVNFCSGSCLNAAKGNHDNECPVMAYILSENSHFLLAIRFFIKLLNKPSHETQDLVHHFHRYTPSYRFDLTVKTLLTSFVLSEMGRDMLDIESDLNNDCLLMSRVLTLFCQIETNSASLIRRTGSAIYPKYSMAAHSCCPNMRYDYHVDKKATHRNRMTGPLLYLYANQDIAADTELTVSYITIGRFQERQAKLEASYYFKCRCNHCLTEMRQQYDAVCIPKKICPLCENDLNKSGGRSDSLEISEHQFSCSNVSCYFTIDFKNDLMYYKDFLRQKLLLVDGNVTDDEVAKMLKSICKHYDDICKLYETPNLIQMDFAVFICKLFYHRNNRSEAHSLQDCVEWAETAFKISDSLLGFHPETAACFFRIITAFDSLKSSDSLTEEEASAMKSEFIRRNVSADQVRYFDDEVPPGKREILMKFGSN